MERTPDPLVRRGANATALARSRGLMAGDGAVFDAFARRARERLAAGDALAAAAWAQIAFDFGWGAPSGRLMDAGLERLLNEVGRAHVPGDPAAHTPSRDVRRVLHVLTEVYEVGGHTRMLRRWIDRDAGREHTVVLVNQRVPVPEQLEAVLARRGGTLIPRLPGADLLARARALRELAAPFDAVVLHIHMHDVVAALAFADPVGRPPVILNDHASHSLWVGAGVTDVLASVDPYDAGLAQRRRGIDRERIAILPLPMDPVALPSRAEARAGLGIGLDRELLVCVTAGWKVRPVLDPSFPELVTAVLERNPEAGLLVAGIDPDEAFADPAWQQMALRTDRRVLVVGSVLDVSPLLAAADLYLDSFPGSGGNTVLEAGAAGLPVLSLDDGSMGRMRPTVPSVDRGIVRAGDPAALGEATAALLADPARRAAMGDALRIDVDAAHGGGWMDHVEALFAAALELRGAARLPEADAAPVEDWEAALQLLVAGNARRPPQAIVVGNHAVLPPHERPGSDAEVHALVAEIAGTGAAAGRRALAAPAVEEDSVRAAVDWLRAKHASGEADTCAVVLAPDAVDAAIPLLQAALDAGPDLDLDVLTAASLAEVRTDADLVLEAA